LIEKRDDIAARLVNREDYCSVVVTGKGNKALYHIVGVVGVKALKEH
jgi:hypothetical protein